jgi:hypothetical protein
MVQISFLVIVNKIFSFHLGCGEMQKRQSLNEIRIHPAYFSEANIELEERSRKILNALKAEEIVTWM